jgi:hypothetical protein
MKRPIDPIVAEIDAFLAEFPMADDTFGRNAARNSRLMERLRAGGRVWPEKAQEIRSFMAIRRALKKHAA